MQFGSDDGSTFLSYSASYGATPAAIVTSLNAFLATSTGLSKKTTIILVHV